MIEERLFKKGDILIPTDECIDKKIVIQSSINFGREVFDNYFKPSKLYPIYRTGEKYGEPCVIVWGSNQMIPEKYFNKSEINFNEITSDEYSWNKVKKFNESKYLDSDDVDWKEAYNELLNHHNNESEFLIDMCKVLAEELKICYEDIYIYDNGYE